MKMEHRNLLVQDDQLIIRSNPSPLFTRIVLLALVVISVLLPIGVTIGATIIGFEFSIAFLVPYVICWGIGAYLFRVYLWNSCGQELLSFKKNKISYVADYKYFKDGRNEVSIENLEIATISKPGNGEEMVVLDISDGTTNIETVTAIPILEADEIMKEIITRYNTR